MDRIDPQTARSTVEESIIQLKQPCGSSEAYGGGARTEAPAPRHRDAGAQLPSLSLDQIAEMLDYTAEGDPDLSPRIRHG